MSERQTKSDHITLSPEERNLVRQMFEQRRKEPFISGEELDRRLERAMSEQMRADGLAD